MTPVVVRETRGDTNVVVFDRVDLGHAVRMSSVFGCVVTDQLTRLDKGYALPPSIGRCADEYAEVRAIRLAMDKEVERVKARETELREHIIANLSKSSDTGAAGLRYRAQIVLKRVPKVMDWGVVWSWAKKNDRLDIFQKRLNETAAKDFEDAEKRPVPGTEIVNVPDVSITKI